MKKLLFTLPLALFADQIDVYHGFQGFLGEKFSELIAKFEENSQHTVRLHAFDDYNTLIAEGLKNKPHLMFGYEVAVATLVDHPDLIPVSSFGISKERYVDSIGAFYSNARGDLVGMPFNISTGVLFYNKMAFKKAGLDPENPPRTWPEMELALEKLRLAGFGGFTTAWPAAYHVEHIAALHAAPLATNNNGLTGEPRLSLGHDVLCYHLFQILNWHRSGLFTYAGQKNCEPEHLFTEGKCAILLQGANRYGLLKRAADFDVGMGALPYWPQFSAKPYTLTTGGAALWAFKGHAKKPEEALSSVEELLVFLSSEESDRWWHETTGYLPVTKAVAKTARGPAVEQVFYRPSSPYSVGLRFPNYLPVRTYLMDHIEKMLAGELTPEQVLVQTEHFANFPQAKL